MDFTVSGNSLKTLARCITSLSRFGNELVIQSSPSQLSFYTLNSSRSAFNSITFKPAFFDEYALTSTRVQCSVLLKALCSVFRTPISNVDHLDVHLDDPDATKLYWTLDCFNGIRKSYGITCNVDPDIQHLSLDRNRYPSHLIVRPRDLTRLLNNFQSSLQEITIIATEPPSLPSDAATGSGVGGKAVELRSYIDPSKDNDSSLHTQLWIDPNEEFVHYKHSGDPVDVTFGMKEWKVFLSFCEGCEVDIQLFFEKAGEPILMAPKFGVDDGSSSNFDYTLVLATMLASQLSEVQLSEPPRMDSTVEAHGQSQGQAPNVRLGVDGSETPSNHTKIWSDLSGSGAKSNSGNEVLTRDGRYPTEMIGNIQISEASHIRRISQNDIQISRGNRQAELNEQGTQHHHSNWIEDNDEDDEDGHEFCVYSTPPQ